jgi:hypothetical protein
MERLMRGIILLKSPVEKRISSQEGFYATPKRNG